MFQPETIGKINEAIVSLNPDKFLFSNGAWVPYPDEPEGETSNDPSDKDHHE
jgi:hypothetical protein